MTEPNTDRQGRRLKELASEVKKLRGWAASDETVAERLTDALNELTAQRLLAHQFIPAIEDAQDALTRANKLVAAHGAVGPFTPIDDGVRFFAATTHLAAAQVGAGHLALGGQMAAALRGWVGLLPHVDLTPYVGARTATWLLMAQGRAALAAGDVASANALADAAAARAREGRLADGGDAALLVDALRFAADARWIAGVEQDAVSLSREAAVAAGAVAAPVLQSSGRVADARVERVLRPLVGTRRELADRLVATGDVDAGLHERRAAAELLLTHRARFGDPAGAALAHTLADLAHDLMGLDRDDEALEVAGRAADVAGQLATTEATAGEYLDTQFAAVTALARVLVRLGEPAEATEALASLFDRYHSLRRPAGFEAALAGATLVRAEVERASGDQQAAEKSLREFHALVRGLRESAGPASSLYAAVPDEAFARDRFRGVATRSSLPTPSWSILSDADALAAATRAPLAVPAPGAPAEEIKPVAPSVEPNLTLEPEPEPEPEPVGVPEPTPAVSEPSALDAAQTALANAKATGNRRDSLTAAQAVVDALQPLFAADAAQWGRDLVSALEELGEAKFRAGDWWGSRGPKKEAKQLAKELGL